MKKSLLALAVLGAFAGSAMAQSSVTLYGVADANISSSKGGASRLTAVGSGGWNGSRFGLRGSEDLGGGLKANFVLESGFGIDTGAGQQDSTAANTTTSTPFGARLFGRQAYVGLSGGFGEVRLGRQYTPIGLASDKLGPLGTKTADLFSVAGSAGNALYRTDNAISYLSPNLGGLTVNAQYSFQVNGAEQNKPNDEAGQHYGFNVLYAGGPFQAGLAYIEVADRLLATADKQKLKGIMAYAGVTFGGFTIKGAYDKTDIGAAEDKQILGLSLEVPFGPVALGFGVAQAKDVTGLAGTSDDATLYTLQANYSLSKRTSLYTIYTGVDNDTSSALGFNGPVNDKRSDQFQVGIRHFF
ncbi:MAG: hypothetical protein RIS44_314 [Pseudomonadota bacterium]|jgi:predicted porin